MVIILRDLYVYNKKCLLYVNHFSLGESHLLFIIIIVCRAVGSIGISQLSDPALSSWAQVAVCVAFHMFFLWVSSYLWRKMLVGGLALLHYECVCMMPCDGLESHPIVSSCPTKSKDGDAIDITCSLCYGFISQKSILIEILLLVWG